MSIMMEYLRQLQKNNQRDWFQSHKELRKEAELSSRSFYRI